MARTKNWYRVYYTLHHGRYNTGHDMYVQAFNKPDAVKQCRAVVREKSDRYAFNCMAILDGPEKYDPRHMEKYVEWAKYYGVYKPEPEPFVWGGQR